MIRIENMTAGFDNKTVFKNLSYVFQEPGSYALMGPSGSGKTTLLRLIAGLLEPESGQIILPKETKISFLFQEDRLLPWETALENVSIISDKNKAEEWLNALEITDTAQYPDEMSGGMCRRVAMARALSYGGNLLLMDEPFNGLDAELKKKAAALICRTASFLIMTTHDAEEAKMMNAKIIDVMELIKNEYNCMDRNGCDGRSDG